MEQIKKSQNLNSLFDEYKIKIMNHNSENLKKKAKEYSQNLTKLGLELSTSQFSYKLEHKPSKSYWIKRIENFEKYKQTGLDYYNQVYSLINLVDKEESQLFMLRISKFHRLGMILIKTMEKIKENPSIIDSKDRQQSLWSKKIKEQITKNSDDCLNHEKEMNIVFRKFYEKNLKKITN